MARQPEEVVRYTVERSGGEYVTDVPDLLSLFNRRKLTDRARRDIRDALWREGVAAEPDLLTVERSEQVRLFLVERESPPYSVSVGAAVAVLPLARRLRPRTWKGWTVYAVAGVFIVAALAGGPEESQDSRPAAAQTPAEPRASETGADEREAEAALREERAALREERARVRRARAQARRERAQARRERAEARRERARIRRVRAAARRRRERQQALAAEAAAAEAAAAEAAASCHPSYDPCLDPNASDYDCDGGSGDGPAYTGFVTVKGPDDYGLDSDGDGTGCE
jgi:hypothetical protein